MAGDRVTADAGSAIVFFDGVCNLCNATVDLIVKRDRRGFFRFASLQSPAAERLLAPFGRSVADQGSVLLLENGRLYQRSEAALRIGHRLSGLRLISILARCVPLRLRDALYDRIARSRYRIFGQRSACRLTDDRHSGRFIVT
ncbi:DUF393 domain-containing protein [candidate division KSB1 bacterium]|nr:DUF393 domain-containing protein [candidate division KSB1 bacterium]